MKFIKGEIETSPPPTNGKGRILPYYTISRDYFWFGNDFPKLNAKMLNLFYSCKQQETNIIDTLKWIYNQLYFLSLYISKIASWSLFCVSTNSYPS